MRTFLLEATVVFLCLVGNIGFLEAGFRDTVRITVDTSKIPELKSFGEKVKNAQTKWFPYISSLLATPTYEPTKTINVIFDPDMEGVAGTGGNNIYGAGDYYLDHQDDVGSMIHEMVHVIQGYPKYVVWITEGIADWVRYYHYEPWRMPKKPTKNDNYKDGYGVTPYFLNYINSKYGVPMIYYLNKACREGTYDDNIFKKLTGKTSDEMWQDLLNDKNAPK